MSELGRHVFGLAEDYGHGLVPVHKLGKLACNVNVLREMGIHIM
jgi:hypothetical protein